MVTVKKAPVLAEVTHHPFAAGTPAGRMGGAGFAETEERAPATFPPLAEYAKFVTPPSARFLSPIAKPPQTAPKKGDDPQGYVCTKSSWEIPQDECQPKARCYTEMTICYPKVGRGTYGEAEAAAKAEVRAEEEGKRAEIEKCKARSEPWAKFVFDFKDGKCVIAEGEWHDAECKANFPGINNRFNLVENRCVYYELRTLFE